MSEKNREYYEMLMMKAVDGELTPSEEKEWLAHLETSPEFQEEWADFKEIKDATDFLRQRILADAEIEPFRESNGVKMMSGLAFSMIGIGALLLLGFSVYSFYMDDTVPLLIKIASSLAGGGCLILFLYLLGVRIRGYQNDPYKEIDL